MMSLNDQRASQKLKKQTRIKTFNHLLSVMNHQRILVMAIAVAQTALSHFILFMFCLGLIHAKEIENVLFLDRIDQKEREEYYETPKIHGVSINEIRLTEGDKLISHVVVMLYIGTVLSAIYALCTLGLLIGTLKRRCELIVPWMVFHTIVCILSGIALLIAYLHRSETIDEYFGNGYTVWFFGIMIFVCNIFMWHVVRAYYESLKMMKRLTEEVVLPIPCPVIPFHFRRENMYIGDGGYKHLLSESNQSYVV